MQIVLTIKQTGDMVTVYEGALDNAAVSSY